MSTTLCTGSTGVVSQVYRLLISVVHRRSDGWGRWLRPGVAPARAHGACHGWAWRLAGVRVFSSYGGRFLMRFAPTGSQWWGKRVYTNLNRWRAATKPDNGEAFWPMVVNGEGSLRWTFGSRDVRQGFLELPSSFSTNQLLRSAEENSNLVAT
jgi:hypothetical protein